jgi:uncharacterized protein (DUF1697 family)
MAVVIGLLRGVNVGGHNKISMDDLRAICVSLRHRSPKTYIQSGNVVFDTTETDMAKLAHRLESAIEKRLGFRPSVILRTAADMREVVARNPFAGRAGFEPAKLYVFFLTDAPSAEIRSKLATINVGPEEIRPAGREIYIYFPDGMGQSKLPPVLDRALQMPATARNWNTVNKLLEMAAGHGDSK